MAGLCQSEMLKCIWIKAWVPRENVVPVAACIRIVGCWRRSFGALRGLVLINDSITVWRDAAASPCRCWHSFPIRLQTPSHLSPVTPARGVVAARRPLWP